MNHRLLAPLALAPLLALSLAACGDDDRSPSGSGGAASTLTAEQRASLDEGATEYADYVRSETDALLSGTEAFVAAYKSGDDDEARKLYAPTRVHWESIEPIAEQFGDLDPKTDAREADLTDGEEWTGWHLLEKDLWPTDAEEGYAPLSEEERAQYADQLLADLSILQDETAELEVSPEQIAGGSKELLDEVANGKITGEEEIWSHTDLYDFQANIDGAEKAYLVLRPVVSETEAELAETLDTRFGDMQGMLDEHRDGQGFVDYSTVPEERRKELSDAVNALAEPLSQLAAAVA